MTAQRVRCPACRRLNSVHRRTCKSCREPLPYTPPAPPPGPRRLLASKIALLALVLYGMLLFALSGPFYSGNMALPYLLFIYSGQILVLLLVANSLGLQVFLGLLRHKFRERPAASYALTLGIFALAGLLFCMGSSLSMDILLGRDPYHVASISAGGSAYHLAARQGVTNSDGGPSTPNQIWVFRCGSGGVLCRAIHRRAATIYQSDQPQLVLDQQAQQLLVRRDDGAVLVSLPIEP